MTLETNVADEFGHEFKVSLDINDFTDAKLGRFHPGQCVVWKLDSGKELRCVVQGVARRRAWRGFGEIVLWCSNPDEETVFPIPGNCVPSLHITDRVAA